MTDNPGTPFALSLLDEDGRKEYWAALALRHCPRLGINTARRLLDTFGSAYEAVHNLPGWGSAELAVHPAVKDAMVRDLWRVTARNEWDSARTLQGEILLWTDVRYPADLREIPDAPPLLYVRGDTSLLHNPAVAVVGTRRCSPRGADNARSLAGGLAAAGLTVVSGLAAGVDSVAHTAAMRLPGGTIAVLGTGLDLAYPPDNELLQEDIARTGLLVSEFAPGTRPEPRNFPIRNRIISGLSLGVLVVEASVKSGSLLTAYLAVKQNRAVYAVAGDLHNKNAEGCHKLIREGAQVIFCSGDVLRDLADILRARQDERLSITLPPPAPETMPAETPAALPAPASADAPAEQPSDQPPVHSPERPAAETAPEPPRTPASSPKKPPRRDTPPKPASADPAGRRIVAELASGPRTVDALGEALDLPAHAVSAELVMLEVRGNVKMLPDGRYSLIG